MNDNMTLGEMAKALNRSPLYLGGLQKRFELPALKGAAYPQAYLAILQAVIALRIVVGDDHDRRREVLLVPACNCIVEGVDRRQVVDAIPRVQKFCCLAHAPP